MGELWDKYKRYGRFSKDEIKSIIITIIALAFVVGYNDGAKTFTASHWIGNFIFVLIFVTAAVMVKQIGYRISALSVGLRPEYQIWWYGIIGSIVICLLTRGHVWVIVPGAIMVHHIAIQRLGSFRYGVNIKAMSMIALASNIALIIFGGILKTIDIWLLSGTNTYIDKIFLFTLAYAAWSLIPIPPLDGSKLFFQSRLVYAFVFGTFAGYAILVSLGVYSYIWALIIGIFVWLIYYIAYERTAWS